MRHFYLIVIFLAFCRCNLSEEKESKCYFKDSLISDKNGNPRDSLTPYFPSKIFKDSCFVPTEISKFGFERYAIYLQCFKEPILYNYYQNKDIYRFIWTRSFHAYVVITIEKNANGIYLTTKTLDRHPRVGIRYSGPQTKYKAPIIAENDTTGIIDSDIKKETLPSKTEIVFYSEIKANIKVNKTISQTKRDWNNFIKLLESNKYWEMKPLVNRTPGIDGAHWLLEAHTRNRYWFVERWSPNESFRQCCEYLIKLSEVKDEEIY